MNSVLPQSSAESILAGRVIGGPASARITIDGRPYINFHGCGYLALSNVPEIRAAVRQAIEQGAPFAQPLPAVLGGIDPLFAAVESAGAVACGTEASVYFASGYQIGAVGLASLEHSFNLIALDEGAHYSLRDAATLSGLPAYTFAHCDAESLSAVLKHNLKPQQRPLLVTDGVFATTGRLPPLADYASVLACYGGRMFVDESHSFGVVGEHGRGAAEHCAVEKIVAAGATLSKAFCAQGALVGCSAATAAHLRSAPIIRGACAGSPLSAAAATASLRYVGAHPELRRTLQAKTRDLRVRLRNRGFDVIDSPAPIVSFQWGNRADMQALERRVFERGIYVYHSNYLGAGPEGMIRCAVFRDHSHEDMDALIEALG
jgi:7-keto-8-aminopelargonate synthetase-like enzyme